MDELRAARTDAESGIARAESLLEEAQRAGSPLAPHIDRYVAQKAAWEDVAASHAAAIARLEHKNAL